MIWRFTDWTFARYYSGRISDRYGLPIEQEEKLAPELLMDITAKRGYKEDYDRGSELVVHDIRQGKLGRYTLDRCEEMEQKAMTESIQSIKERLKSIQRIDDPTLESLRNDPRKGVQQALVSFERRLKKRH